MRSNPGNRMTVLFIHQYDSTQRTEMKTLICRPGPESENSTGSDWIETSYMGVRKACIKQSINFAS